MKDEYFAGCIYADRYFPLSETEPDDYYQLLNREAAFIYWKTSSQSKMIFIFMHNGYYVDG